MKPLKIIWILAILTAILAGCGYSKEQLEGEYSSGYEEGYDNGFEDGKTEGWNEALAELESDGILKQEEYVFLSNDGTDTYHMRYCRLANWDIGEVPLWVVKSWGYTPCQECGGEGELLYAGAGATAEYSYKEGFQYAVNFILDRMDEEYREQWWDENIEEIMEIGLEY